MAPVVRAFATRSLIGSNFSGTVGRLIACESMRVRRRFDVVSGGRSVGALLFEGDPGEAACRRAGRVGGVVGGHR